jgi:hypothetical protein
LKTEKPERCKFVFTKASSGCILDGNTGYDDATAEYATSSYRTTGFIGTNDQYFEAKPVHQGMGICRVKASASSKNEAAHTACHAKLLDATNCPLVAGGNCEFSSYYALNRQQTDLLGGMGFTSSWTKYPQRIHAASDAVGLKAYHISGADATTLQQCLLQCLNYYSASASGFVC